MSAADRRERAALDAIAAIGWRWDGPLQHGGMVEITGKATAMTAVKELAASLRADTVRPEEGQKVTDDNNPALDRLLYMCGCEVHGPDAHDPNDYDAIFVRCLMHGQPLMIRAPRQPVDRADGAEEPESEKDHPWYPYFHAFKVGQVYDVCTDCGEAKNSARHLPNRFASRGGQPVDDGGRGEREALLEFADMLEGIPAAAFNLAEISGTQIRKIRWEAAEWLRWAAARAPSTVERDRLAEIIQDLDLIERTDDALSVADEILRLLAATTPDSTPSEPPGESEDVRRLVEEAIGAGLELGANNIDVTVFDRAKAAALAALDRLIAENEQRKQSG